MRKVILLTALIFITKISFSQIEVRDSVFIKFNEVDSKLKSFYLTDGKIGVVHVFIKNKYEKETGYVTGYFNSNLTLKQKHKLDPSKVITYDQFVELINKDILDVFYHYKIYFIISEARYDYLTLQVRQIMPPEFTKQ